MRTVIVVSFLMFVVSLPLSAQTPAGRTKETKEEKQLRQLRARELPLELKIRQDADKKVAEAAKKAAEAEKKRAAQAADAKSKSTTAPTKSSESTEVQKLREEKEKLELQIEIAKRRKELEDLKATTPQSSLTEDPIGIAPTNEAVTIVTNRAQYDTAGRIVALEGSKEWADLQKKLAEEDRKKAVGVEKAKHSNCNWFCRQFYSGTFGSGYVSYGNSYNTIPGATYSVPSGNYLGGNVARQIPGVNTAR